MVAVVSISSRAVIALLGVGAGSVVDSPSSRGARSMLWVGPGPPLPDSPSSQSEVFSRSQTARASMLAGAAVRIASRAVMVAVVVVTTASRAVRLAVVVVRIGPPRARVARRKADRRAIGRNMMCFL